MILAIDPGMRSVGVALFDESGSNVTVTQLLFARSKADRMESTVAARKWLNGVLQGTELTELTNGQRITKVIIECPDFVLRKRGRFVQNVVKLAMSIAGMVIACNERQVSLKLVDVRDWKGSKSKEATRAECKDAFGDSVDEWGEHETDACGIGLWWFRQLEAANGASENDGRLPADE